jgi:hypothetical protein
VVSLFVSTWDGITNWNWRQKSIGFKEQQVHKLLRKALNWPSRSVVVLSRRRSKDLEKMDPDHQAQSKIIFPSEITKATCESR